MNDPNKPLISLILPTYNEENILVECLNIIVKYLRSEIAEKYNWEIVIVNDGSKDKTGELADQYALDCKEIKVVHHDYNKNLGNAIKTGFEYAAGDYFVVYDIDLSYSPDHIMRLLDTIVEEKADIVIASPYMKGGMTTAIPFGRKIMSKWANKYLYLTNRKKIYTFSGMVRAYRASFIKHLSLKASTYEINTEIIFKAQILRARIIEIPAHLDWTFQNQFNKQRFSGIRIKSGILNGIVSGFIFRPYMFFFIPGIFLLFIFLYISAWILINIFRIYNQVVVEGRYFDDRFSQAVAQVFAQRPYAFVIGGFCLLVALLFLGIGFLSLQNKRYFDELFYLNSGILRKNLPKN
jgi:glycosyltransferase involved in cell wall biosynthesis